MGDLIKVPVDEFVDIFKRLACREDLGLYFSGRYNSFWLYTRSMRSYRLFGLDVLKNAVFYVCGDFQVCEYDNCKDEYKNGCFGFKEGSLFVDDSIKPVEYKDRYVFVKLNFPYNLAEVIGWGRRNRASNFNVYYNSIFLQGLTSALFRRFCPNTLFYLRRIETIFGG